MGGPGEGGEGGEKCESDKEEAAYVQWRRCCPESLAWVKSGFGTRPTCFFMHQGRDPEPCSHREN